MLNFKEALEEFLFDCKGRGLSEETVKNYGYNISIFLRFMQEKDIDNVEDITNRHVKQFVIEQQKKEYKVSYINTNLRSMRAFFTYLHEESYIDNIPNTKNIRKDNKVIETFTNEEIGKILDTLHRPKNFIEYRDKAILYVMVDCGLRAGEIIKLRDEDVKENNTLFVQGKGRKERYIPFSPLVRKAFMQYERVKKSYFLDKPYIPNKYFLSRYGQEISRFILQNLVITWGEKAGINREKLFPHNFRHFYAVSNLKNGLDLYSLSRLMGHSEVNITSIYASSIRDEEIRDLSIKSSPLMNLKKNK